MAVRYQINAPAVIGEVMDNEAIIVNLDSGAYYSLRDVGATVWALLAEQPTQAEIVQALQRSYAGESDALEAGVSELLALIMAENLVRAVDDPTAVAPEPLGEAPQADLPPFVTPILEKYTDMADLLLLDPIHEVDEAAGWPKPQ